MKPIALLVSLLSILGLSACSSPHPPMKTVDYVDLNRFMGDWYVIAAIPTFLEKESYNAVESYALTDEGNVATTFTFLEGGFDGKKKEFHPMGFVVDKKSNALWGMQFIWPIKAEYRIVYVDEDYSQTIIGRTKRDYVWIMARTPVISDADYAKLLAIVEEAGYNMEDIRKVPQEDRPD